MLDVLEHLENDRAVLGEVKRVLKPGGVAIVTVAGSRVPFFRGGMRFWGTSGATRGDGFCTIAHRAGLDVLRLSYWNLIGLLPALVLRGTERFIGSRREHAEFPRISRWMNHCLTQWGRIECSIVEKFDQPMGLSLVAVLRKQEVRRASESRAQPMLEAAVDGAR